MDINNILKENFKEVNKAFLEKESGTTFLRVEVNIRELNKIAIISTKISDFLDEHDTVEGEYFLDVFSPGTDQVFEPKNSKDYIGEYVQVSLKKHIKEMKEFKGELLSFENDEIIVRWNAKGQFRKQPIAIDNIELIKTYTIPKKK